MRVDWIIPARAELGEGMNLFPDGRMRWVDLPNGHAYIFDGQHNQDWLSLGHEISKVLPWEHGAIVLGQTAIIFLDKSGIEVERIELHKAETKLRCSDGLVLPNGELLVGILDRDLTPNRSRLIKVNLDRSITEIVSVATISNGITLLADGVRIAWTDSPRKSIEVFDFDFESGKVYGRRNHAELPDGIGLADGMCADSTGGIWAALWAGSGIAHFDGAGSLVEIIKFAAPNVTSCAFDQRDDLIITTGTATLSASDLERFPGAGGLWRIEQAEHGAHRLPIHLARF